MEPRPRILMPLREALTDVAQKTAEEDARQPGTAAAVSVGGGVTASLPKKETRRDEILSCSVAEACRTFFTTLPQLGEDSRILHADANVAV